MDLELCEIFIDDTPIRVPVGSVVAAAIMNSSDEASPCSSFVPLCGMGICWGCRLTIDGRADVRACLVRVAPGMKVRRGSGS